MLLVVGIGVIIIATMLTLARQQKPQKRLWVDFSSYAFVVVMMSWVAVSSLVDGERLLPAVAAVSVMISMWRLIQTGFKLRMAKQS